jgi:photosystem II stability/assembly factor-like uncharacterized protein
MDGGIESAACDQRACLAAAENQAVTIQALGLTTNGGKTWSRVSGPASWVAASITPNLVACSASRCLAYGGNSPFYPSPGKAHRFHEGFAATSDDGRTWTEITLPGAAGIDQMACAWSGQCWALYETRSDALEHVATTVDGGSRWLPLELINPSEVGGDTFALDPDHIVGFACDEARTCFILDNSNDLLTSTDGGRTWSSSAAPRDAHGSTQFSTDAMTCTSASTCWIVSSETTSAWIGTPTP